MHRFVLLFLALSFSPANAKQDVYRFWESAKSPEWGCSPYDESAEPEHRFHYRVIAWNIGVLGECGEMSGRELRGVTLNERYAGSLFRGTDLTGAALHLDLGNFAHADFTGAILRDAVFETNYGNNINVAQGINLSKADLCGADFSVFTAAVMTWFDLKGAVYNEKTKFPKDFDPKSRGMIEENERGLLVSETDDFERFLAYSAHQGPITAALAERGMRFLPDLRVNEGTPIPGLVEQPAEIEVETRYVQRRFLNSPHYDVSVTIRREGRKVQRATAKGWDSEHAEDSCGLAILRAVEKLKAGS